MSVNVTGHIARRIFLTTLILLIFTGVRCRWFEPGQTRAETLYNEGKYTDALPLLRAQAESARTGTLLYQLGYCIYAVEGNDDERRSRWEEAIPLLEKELSGPEGATLGRLYYLASIHMNQGDLDAMQRISRRAVDEIEKGPHLTSLDGVDWFRLARIHDWLNEPSQAEAAYRRAVSAFSVDGPVDNPAYQTLALALVGDLDFLNLRYRSAADNYNKALELVPGNKEIRPFNHGISLLAIDQFADATARFIEDRDPKTREESRLAAEIARLSEEAGPLIEEDFDGMKLGRMPMGTLQNRILESGEALRQVRNRHSYKTGDPLVPELLERQKRFISLVRERLTRTREVQAFLEREGLAELVRR